jgi:hypothetical protein
MGSFRLFSGLAVVIIADLIAATLQLSNSRIMSAAIPAMCGADIDVPE